jgi:pimeloyl-ACP methyl ester carboxylesterase
MAGAVTHELQVPGAVLQYDVRESEPAGGPTLVMIGSPMPASGFTALASCFADHTVVTYDPRGMDRSERTDPAELVTPETHADDVHAVIEAIGGGPVDMFGSSGGAVTALALVAAHPDLVRTLVAHEPPAISLLPDADNALAACRAIYDTYQRAGFGAGMAQFIAFVSIQGPVPAEFATQPAPDPARFGLPADDDGTRTDLLLASNMLTVTSYRPDFDRLRSAATRIVPAVGADSRHAVAGRGGLAVAERLGTNPVEFPGGHGGFLGPDSQPPGDPEAFAARLREVLTAAT